MMATRPAAPHEDGPVGRVYLSAPPLPSGIELPEEPPGPWYETELETQVPLVHDTTPAPAPVSPEPDMSRLLRASDPALKLGLAAFTTAELRRLADQLGDLIDVCEENPSPSPLSLWLRQSEARVLSRLAFIDGGAP